MEKQGRRVRLSTTKQSSTYTLIGIGLSLLVIIYVAEHLDWASAKSRLLGADLLWLGAGLGVFAVNYIMRTLRFRALLSTPQIDLRRALGVMMLYGMFNYLLPAKSGEVSYVWLSHRYLNTRLSEGTATLIATRFFDFGVIAVVLPVVLATFFEQLASWVLVSASTYCVLVVAAAVVLVRYLRSHSFPAPPPVSSTSVCDRLCRVCRQVMLALRNIDQRGNYLRLWLLSGGIWLCVYTNFYCIVTSLGFDPTFLQMIVVSIILVPLTLLPVQGIANIGAHEAGFVTALSLFGYPIGAAVGIAVTSHVVLFLFVLIWEQREHCLCVGRGLDDSHWNPSSSEPRSYKFVSFVLDRIFARCRWLLLPFGLARRVGAFINTAFWLLCNEHAKSKFSHCGNGVRIYGRFSVSAPDKLHIGDNVHINSGAFFRTEGGLRIDDNVHIARNLLVYTINHNYQGESLPYDNTVVAKPVHIEKNVWIGAHVVITPE